MGFHRILLVVCCMGMVGLTTSSSRSISSSPQLYLPSALTGQDSPFDVTRYGAVGDGQTDDSQAFLKAWNATCGATGNSITLQIPAGKTFLLKPLKFEGPCNAPFVTVQIEGKIIAPSQLSDWSDYIDELKQWISFHSIESLTVTGNGIIDGQGSEWWQACDKNSEGDYCDKRPTALAFSHCDKLKLSGLKHNNSQRNHISIISCDGATVSGLQITAPETSPNTDGIDISSSDSVTIYQCHIATGDDCIAIGNNCSNINITGILCGPGHGISVGSLGIHGESSAVEEIHVSNCTFVGTENGARIKTWQGGSGYARKISFDKINLVDADHPIIINQYYSDMLTATDNQESSAVKISNVTYTNFRGTSSSKDAIDLRCSQAMTCDDIVLDHINITSANPQEKTIASCINAHASASDTLPNVDCSSQQI